MGVFGAHTGRDSGGSTSRLTQFIVLIIVGLIAFLLSFTRVVPNDIFTSALFFDSLDLQPVFSQPATMFAEGGIWASLPDVSEEAFVFAASLLVIQVLVGYKASTIGGYTNKSQNVGALLINAATGKEKIGRTSFNWAKVGWISFYWAISMFDTYTDTAYRSDLFASGVFTALITSFFYYNLASEWMLMVGAKTTIDYSLRAIGEFKNVAGRAKMGGGMPMPQMGVLNQQQRSRPKRRR